VDLCEAKPDDVPLPAAVPQLLARVFDADAAHVFTRGKTSTNVTCLQPAVEGTGDNVIDDELAATKLKPGRVCAGGECCDACSRVHFPGFTTAPEAETFMAELEQVIVPPLHQFSLQKCAFRDMRTTLIFVRLVERMRRAIALEYGLRLETVLPLQTFVACFMGAQDKQGGLHSDESTHAEFHYSCVLYLTSQGEDFTGGTFSYSDAPAVPGGPRLQTPLAPRKGSAVIFSSGWENMHEVEPLEGGTRVAVPSFFTTQVPLPEEHGQPPVDDAHRAQELWNNLIAPEEVSDFRKFMARWHCLLAPGR